MAKLNFRGVRLFPVLAKAGRNRKGFSLIEVLVALILILIVGGAVATKLYSSIKMGQAAAITDFINKAETAYTILANSPYCQTPSSKTAFINEASDSQCRSDTTDHRGNYDFQEKINGKWDWDISNGQLIVKDVPPEIGEKVVKIRTECTYDSGKKEITCPLSAPPA